MSGEGYMFSVEMLTFEVLETHLAGDIQWAVRKQPRSPGTGCLLAHVKSQPAWLPGTSLSHG